METVTAEEDPLNATGAEDAANSSAYIDYDAEQSVKIYFWGELATALVVYGLTFIIGFIGNVLILVAITGNRRMKSVTNTFLASLATADLTLICLCIPVKVSRASSLGRQMRRRPRHRRRTPLRVADRDVEEEAGP